MNNHTISFKQFLFSGSNKKWATAGLVVGILYFVSLRILYPIPSFYSDSFTWVGAAQSGQPVTFRPIGYSKVIMFFRLLGQSDLPLIAAQYFTNLLVNLFLFFTATFLFQFRTYSKFLLYVVLVINPFYLFYSNYVSSDAFFNSLAVLWFTLLIWILYRPTWALISFQLIVLAALFELRYNAIFFPAVSTLAVLLSRMHWIKKATSIGISIILIAGIVFITTRITAKYTGVSTFSAFSGWQLANDALHIVQHAPIDTSNIKDQEVRHFTRFIGHFFDTARQTFPDSGATAVFMWHINSPLKRYMFAYPKRSKSYFKTWNTLGPLYNKFGKTIILQRPVTYLEHFVIPNAGAYFVPPLEIFETYMEDRDTIARVATQYFHYKSNKTPRHHPVLYAWIFTPMQYLFISINFVFVFTALYYAISGIYRGVPVLFNHTLLCFTSFFAANFFFIVLLAPSVFRYHIFILTLSFPIILYLVQRLSLSIQQKEPG